MSSSASKKKKKMMKGMEKQTKLKLKLLLHKRTASSSFSPAHTDENKYTTQMMPDPKTMNP